MSGNNKNTSSIVHVCPYCTYNFCAIEHVPPVFTCPACKLFSKIEEHLKDVFQNIVTQFYSGYIFEIEDYSRHCLKAHGFSFLQDRKHNQNIIWKNSEIGIKTFYLLMYSYIEAIFYEIQNFMNEQEIPVDKDLIYQFNDFIKNTSSKSYNLCFQGRYVKSIEFIRLIANVIKHTSGVVKNEQSGTHLIKNYGFLENGSIFENKKKIKGIGRLIYLEDVFELGCMVHVYFRDIVSNLTCTKIYRYKSFDRVKSTYDLVDLQLRRDIGYCLMKQSKSEGLAFFPNCDLSNLNDEKIILFIENKKKIIDILYKKDFKDVVRFEIYGHCHYESRKLAIYISLINNILHLDAGQYKDSKNSIKKIPNETLTNFLRKLSEKYNENIIMKIYFNQYDKLSTSFLAKYIKDFYDELFSLRKSDRIMILKLIGAAPFRGWDPFMFGMNKINYW